MHYPTNAQSVSSVVSQVISSNLQSVVPEVLINSFHYCINFYCCILKYEKLEGSEKGVFHLFLVNTMLGVLTFSKRMRFYELFITLTGYKY